MTYDELWPGGPKFRQSDAAFPLSTDSVLLAHFAAGIRARRIYDLGCGAGVLCVLLARSHPAAEIGGIELQAEAAERGTAFIFTVAPNKNSLYPEEMPAWAEGKHEEANIVRLFPWLERYGVNYVDLFGLNMPYYRTDSHWT
ncbi:MAG: methyltransferase, partial [Oscillospiraceae bacterium]|nr:methyltransferase [Oscillospiraceae bacterium]